MANGRERTRKSPRTNWRDSDCDDQGADDSLPTKRALNSELLEELVREFGDLRNRLVTADAARTDGNSLANEMDRWMIAHAAMYQRLEGEAARGGRRLRPNDDLCRGFVDPHDPVFDEVYALISRDAGDDDIRFDLGKDAYTTTTIHTNTSRYA